MDLHTAILLLPFIVGAAYVTWLVLQDKLFERALERVSPDVIEQISEEVAGLGDVESTVIYIGPKLSGPEDSLTLNLPQRMKISWLAGKCISAKLRFDPPSECNTGDVWLENERRPSTHCLTAVPRMRGASGKEFNRYAVGHWFKKRPNLETTARELWPKNPEAFVSRLLHRNGVINAPIRILDDELKTNCAECDKRLTPVFEFWGAPSPLVHYVFACECTSARFYVFGELVG